MKITDTRVPSTDLKTWDQLEPGQVFTDTTETEYPTYYMRVNSWFVPAECYIDLEDGSLHKFAVLDTTPRYKVLNAEMHIND